MVATAEGQVLVRIAVEVHLVGLELRVVGVGRAEHEAHAVAGVDLDVVQSDVLGRSTRHDHDRCQPAQHLLYGGGDAGRIRDELLTMVGVLRQEGDHAVQRRRHGVEPAEQEQVADTEQLRLGERLPVDSRMDDRGQQ
jgi:hypothetical protein